MSFVATPAASPVTTSGTSWWPLSNCFGQMNRVPSSIEWLTDNGSCYVARETGRFAREIEHIPRTTPIESPQSNGTAEAFVRTLKRWVEWG